MAVVAEVSANRKPLKPERAAAVAIFDIVYFVKPYRVCQRFARREASIDAVPLARLLFARSGARAFARAIAIP